MAFVVVIPARFASSRLPGKPLADICGKPMIQHVYEKACQSGASKVVIATDHQDVFNIAQSFNAQVVMTKDSHESGTERLAEVVDILNLPKDTIVVNVQRRFKHRTYSKFVNSSKKYHAHDAANVAKIGDSVTIIESRAHSKLKKWELVTVNK